MQLTEKTVARELAESIAGLSYEDLTPNAIRAAKEAILDQFGIMLMGSTLPWTRPAHDVAVEAGSRAQSTIVGSTVKVSILDAAMVNSNYGHAMEFDDTGYSGGAHSGAISVPTALAVAEAGSLSGRDFILGVACGYQVLHQVGRVLTHRVSRIGFHPQSIIGPFGAAAVIGRMRGLPAETLLHALSIAGSHASGTMEYARDGGEVKRFHSGMAVRGGIMAALLAERGMTGPTTIFEGERGVVALFARQDDAQRITEHLDDTDWFAVERRTVKMYPTVGQLPTSIQALERLVTEHDILPDDVERIDVWVTPHTLEHGAVIDEPRDTIGAQFSMKFSLALLLLRGRNDLRDYMDPSLWSDPRIRSLSARISPHSDDQYVFGQDKGNTARVEVTLRDGRTVKTVEEYRRGSPQNPITREDLRRKFRSLASAVRTEPELDSLIDVVDHLDEVDDVTSFMPLLTGPGR